SACVQHSCHSLLVGSGRSPRTQPDDGLALHIETLVVVVVFVEVETVSDEYDVLQNQCLLPAYVLTKRYTVSRLERSGHAIDVNWHGRPVHRSHAENWNTLEVTSVVAAGLDPSIFKLIGDVRSRQPETFGKRATAFKIVRRDITQPLPEQIRTQGLLLCRQ